VAYRRAVQVGNLIFVAGTTAAVADGEPVGGNDAAAQTREAIRRIEAALTQLGADLRSVVQTRIFVTEIAGWEAVGRAHGLRDRDCRRRRGVTGFATPSRSSGA
jgi:enamine deaminase RidA (YjgF/YER057c/UK114 family)